MIKLALLTIKRINNMGKAIYKWMKLKCKKWNYIMASIKIKFV